MLCDRRTWWKGTSSRAGALEYSLNPPPRRTTLVSSELSHQIFFRGSSNILSVPKNFFLSKSPNTSERALWWSLSGHLIPRTHNDVDQASVQLMIQSSPLHRNPTSSDYAHKCICGVWKSPVYLSLPITLSCRVKSLPYNTSTEQCILFTLLSSTPQPGKRTLVLDPQRDEWRLAIELRRLWCLFPAT